MRVTVDPDCCQGHGMCALEAPEVFDVPKVGVVQIRHDHVAAHESGVRAAVRACPTFALTLEES